MQLANVHQLGNLYLRVTPAGSDRLLVNTRFSTAPVECRPKFWKRYVDDVLELIKKGQVRNLTDNINTIDPTGNIKFTYEVEEDKQILFLDTLLVLLRSSFYF